MPTGLTAADFLQPKTIVQLGYPPNRIDIITSISGVAFEAWEHRVNTMVDGIPVVVVGKEALLANKATTGRPKDRADLDALS
jgi:hypothetical protein